MLFSTIALLDGHCGCFQFLAISNDAAIDRNVYVGGVPGRGTVESKGIYVYNVISISKSSSMEENPFYAQIPVHVDFNRRTNASPSDWPRWVMQLEAGSGNR